MSVLLVFLNLITPETWISVVVSFFLGFLSKVLTNIFLTPNIVIDTDILWDCITKKPYIKISNKSRFEWNTAYDLQIFLTYNKYEATSQKYIPFHTGFIKDGKLIKDAIGKYFVCPKNGFENLQDASYKLDVTFVCKNKFGTYLIVDQECAFEMSVIKNNISIK